MAKVFVAENDWSKVKKGDLVRLENGDGNVEFIVERTHNNMPGRTLSSSSANYTSTAWSLEIAVEPEELPTESGFYIDNHGTVFQLVDARWCTANADRADGGLAGWEFELLTSDGTTFTRLEPVPVTAKVICDRIDKMRAEGAGYTLGQVQQIIRAEFGVIS